MSRPASGATMARIFIRVVDDKTGMTVDMVGHMVAQLIVEEEKSYDPYSFHRMRSYTPRKFWASIVPHPFEIDAYRVSEPEAVINWSTEPGEIPTPERLILGEGAKRLNAGNG